MVNENLYIHETIRISVRRRKEYLDHFCSWGPTTRKLYDMRCVGVWAPSRGYGAGCRRCWLRSP